MPDCHDHHVEIPDPKRSKRSLVRRIHNDRVGEMLRHLLNPFFVGIDHQHFLSGIDQRHRHTRAESSHADYRILFLLHLVT